MKTHTVLGFDAIATAERHLGTCTPFFDMAKTIALTHHEKWDGTGYPRGLKGSEIPLVGRIMAISDVYDALVSRRVYKPAMPHAEAVGRIMADRGSHFDPQLSDVFHDIASTFRDIHERFHDQPKPADPVDKS
jgi:putative two-component system response regulator